MAHLRTEEFVCIQDFEDYALEFLSKNATDFYKCGAGFQQTLKENLEAFLRLRLRPRFLRNVSTRTLNTTVLGQPISFPIGVSPTAMQKMAHPDGEIANARACAASGIVMVLSTGSTTSIEEVASASPSGLRWLQIYIFKDRDITEVFVKRAEDNNYQALVLTVDMPLFGNRLSDRRNKFVLPPHLRFANFDSNDTKSSGLSLTEGESNLGTYADTLLAQSLAWEDIKWLKSITHLPIVIKGILTSEDAILAVKHGVSAIWVSNHGARQLDGVPATIEVLPEVVRAVQGRCEVYLDGGIRSGTDVLKALALGARATFIGRPMLWGLAHSGETGARRVLEIMRSELDLAMGLAGCSQIDDIKPDLVVRQEYYSRL